MHRRIPTPATATLWHRLEQRSQRTAEHAQRVLRLADLLAEGLGIDDEDRDHLRVAARFHDVGELALPANLSDQELAYSAEQRQSMMRHAGLGAEALAD